ncbi:hypothetical protein [Dongshaea marina]|uniref:hypothetical protein n=1 Tax=Dongshaea marina TaxID=2047966 RepID=UPI000D3E1975|nr:hypothetical protein [Dongshaea marina]
MSNTIKTAVMFSEKEKLCFGSSAKDYLDNGLTVDSARAHGIKCLDRGTQKTMSQDMNRLYLSDDFTVSHLFMTKSEALNFFERMNFTVLNTQRA